METRKKMITALSVLAPAALMAWIYLPTFSWLYERFMAADSYYSHGFLVPAVSGALIWMRRKELQGIKPVPNYAGLALCVAALGLHIVSVVLRVHFAGGFSLFFLVLGMVLFLFGPRLTGKLMPPIMFLVFMLPLPLVALNNISMPLKSMVARITDWILRGFCGLPMTLQGFRIDFPGSSLTIENPCSGLRSLIVMLALGYVFACLSGVSRPGKIALFLLSVPVAVVSNAMRVVMLSLAVFMYGEKAAEGFFHDLSGYLSFAAAAAVMFSFKRALQCKASR